MFVVHLMYVSHRIQGVVLITVYRKHSSHIALVLVDSSIEEDWPTVLGDATPVGRIIEREQPFVELSRWKPWDVVRVGLDARQDVLRRTRIPSI